VIVGQCLIAVKERPSGRANLVVVTLVVWRSC
jgi:hypothetical protein